MNKLCTAPSATSFPLRKKTVATQLREPSPNAEPPPRYVHTISSWPIGCSVIPRLYRSALRMSRSPGLKPSGCTSTTRRMTSRLVIRIVPGPASSVDAGADVTAIAPSAVTVRSKILPTILSQFPSSLDCPPLVNLRDPLLRIARTRELERPEKGVEGRPNKSPLHSRGEDGPGC